MKIHDSLFDIKWINELASGLLNSPWQANNTANRTRWPYGMSGTHRLLGHRFFFRENQDQINYSSWNRELANTLINAFQQQINKNKLTLIDISANLQFKGMDGTWHTDGDHRDTSFVLMLYYPEDKVTGGELLLKPNTTVKFKQGRLIEFPANQSHRANAFNQPFIPRMSIKWVGRE